MTSSTLRVVHSTGYRYEGGATSSFNEVRMTPRSDGSQVVLHTRLDVSPTAWTHAYTDYWGTAVTSFEVHELHDQLRVVSTSTVDVNRGSDGDRSASWATLRTPQLLSDFAEFLECRRLVAPHPDLAATMADLAGRAATPEVLVASARALIAERIAYVPGVTSVSTTADEVWSKGAGVCQDLSHLTIGALRVAGVPARYVSGYLMTDEGQGIDEPVTGQSHAWIEYWAGSWVPLDPTNSGIVRNDHVVVGRGRDYSDVPPMRGIFTGGPAVGMYVEVSMTRMR